MAPRETKNNAYAKFWDDKQRTLWYVMVFLEWSIHDYVHLDDQTQPTFEMAPGFNPFLLQSI